MNPWYITGLCESLGVFTYSKSNNNIVLYFSLQLPSADENLVNCISSFFGVGNVYKTKRNNSKKNLIFYYRVTKIKDLISITYHFDQYPLLGEKKKKYEIWKEMVNLKMKFRRYDPAKLEELAKKLSNI